MNIPKKSKDPVFYVRYKGVREPLPFHDVLDAMARMRELGLGAVVEDKQGVEQARSAFFDMHRFFRLKNETSGHVVTESFTLPATVHTSSVGRASTAW